jgi:hypothetical protein
VRFTLHAIDDREPTRWQIIFLSTVFLMAGCGRSDLHRVSGTVSFSDGSPVPTGRVVVAYGDGKGAWGIIKPDSSFTIGTLKDNDGMRAGAYKVAVKDAMVPGEAPGTFKSLVHPRFADPATSGLEFTVPDQTTWDIVVEKP